MPINDVKKLYPDSKFQPESPNQFGLCSSGEDGISVYRNDSLLFYFWKDWEQDQVGGFILFDSNQAYQGVHPGMTVSDFLRIHPNAVGTISLMDSKEYLFVPSNDDWYQVESTLDDLSANYKMVEGEYEFLEFRDLEKRISSIFVK